MGGFYARKSVKIALTEPVVYPQIWDEIPNEEVLEAIGSANPGEDASRDNKTQIAQEDQMLILPLIQRAGREEVVDTTGEAIPLSLTLTLALALMAVVAGHVGNQVQGPAGKLLANHVSSGVEWGLVHQLRKLVNCLSEASSINLPGLRNEHHITLHVAGCLVVLAVRDLPGEVRNQQRRVQDPADGVVDRLGGRERLMAALVRQNPQTGTE